MSEKEAEELNKDDIALIDGYRETHFRNQTNEDAMVEGQEVGQ